MPAQYITHTLYGAGRGEWGEAQYIHIFLRSTYAAPDLATIPCGTR